MSRQRYLRVTEADRTYLQNLKAYLMGHGAKAVEGDERLLDLGGTELNGDDYHGCTTHAERPAAPTVVRPVESPRLPNPDATFTLDQEYAAERAWLAAYSGNFEFYLSLRDQLTRRGSLSPKQWECLSRAVERDGGAAKALAAHPVAMPASAPKAYSIAVGTIIVVGRYKAKQLAEQAGLVRPHFAFEVLKVEAETERAYKLTLKCTAQRTTYCSVCGLHLTNPESVTNGIGPICAENWGLSGGSGSLEELAAKLMVSRAVSAWIPKAAIKDRIEPITKKEEALS